MQEQLQQMNQHADSEPVRKSNTLSTPPRATSSPIGAAPFSPWKVSAKHLNAPQRHAEEAPPTTDKQKRHKNGNRKKIAKLAAYWPDCFSLDSVRPLSIGIQDALIADAEARELPITVSQIRYCLSAYTKRPAYAKVMAAGGTRYDLSGQPCGEVTAEQQRAALIQIEGMRQKQPQPPES
ncbi:ProP effector [compost metagenome]